EVGVDAKFATPDPDALRAAFMVDPSVETLTFRDLQERRQDIRQKIQTRRSTRRRGGRAGERSMPELPQMPALAERLDAEFAGATLTGVEPLGFSALKTVVPGPETLVGTTLEHVGRYAKYLILDFGPSSRSGTEPAGRLLIHLSQAGRLDVEEPP